MRKIYLGIGTNLGDREDNLRGAMSMIKEHIGRVIRSSSVYKTEPWGFDSEDSFLNIVAEIDTELDPYRLLDQALMTEAKLGRVRTAGGYKSRLIDIDILLYGRKIINSGILKIPHPRIHERRFVLEPLNEIAPEIVHPLLKKKIKTLLEECDDRRGVERTDIIIEEER